MSGRTRVLLVGHDASRTGAPSLGLSWLRWAADRPELEVAAWFAAGGPLLEDVAATCPTRLGSGRLGRMGRAVAGASTGRLSTAGAAVGRPHHDLGGSPIVVANTVAAWSSAAAVRRRSRLVVWVHELDHVASRVVAPERRAALLAQTDQLVAEGDRVAEMLVERWNVPAARVTVVDSFIDPPSGDEPAPAGRAPVVAVGSLTPRKGPDAFVATIATLRARHPDLRAAWIGGPLGSPTADLVRHDLAAADLADRIELVGEVADVTAHLPAEGILLHTAREDPAPVAVLEAAARGLAVVTWDTGGTADLLRRAGLGHLVAPAGDVLGLARRVDGLLADPAARRRAAEALGAEVAKRSTDRLAPELLRAIVGSAP